MRPCLSPEDLSRLTAALADRFAIERELGQGGMATVLLARDLKHGRRVAVKVLRPELAAVLGTERFLREIQTVARLSHPHILQLHDSGEADGFLYFVMPFVDGESLRDRLDREGPLPVTTAVQLASEIADALDYAHRHGVVHRDIKPENILLQTGHAVVSDFGIAKALDAASGEGTARTALTATGMGIGTPLYMSPEQVMGDQVDGRADIYSLGCVLYQMLEGRPPFEGPTPIAVATQHSVAPVPPLKHCRAAVSPALERAVYKALAKAPDDRFATAGEFRAALTGAIPVAAPPFRWPLTRRATATTALVAAMVVMLVAKTIVEPHKTPSIAVLAFTNIGGDSANEFFSDGVPDEITTKLGGVAGLQVTARSLAHSYKGDTLGALNVGRRLHVRYVLDGGVRMGGNHRRISVQLTDVTTGTEVWSADFDPDVSDTNVFAVQDSIARAVVEKLKIHLSGPATAALATRSTHSPEAHDLYLKGRFAWNHRDSGPAALKEAIGYFNQAIALDSNYALAWAGLADANSMMPAFGDTPPAEPFARAKAAAQRALTLDSTIAEVHTSLAIIAMFHDWDWTTAGREFDRALAIDSTESQTHLFRAWLLFFRGQPLDSTIAELRTAHRLDPGSRLISTRLAEWLPDNKEAEAMFDTLLAHDSTNVAARGDLGGVLARDTLRLPEAFAIFQKLEDTTHLNFQAGAAVGRQLACTYARHDRKPEALKVQHYLEDRARTHYVEPTVLSLIALCLGDTARSMDWLERAHDERAFFLPITLVRGAPRNQPRVQRIARDMGIPLPLPQTGKAH